ncbi:hypothetical protein [Streptomyces wuyuanensis]|uniref:hypothetical protein n=1 Tax=Streptomyces wuyuanensis TaxID=1196353 RepID=UPI0034316272
MTVPAGISVAEPIGVVANSVVSTTYAIVKDLNGKVEFTVESPATVGTVPGFLNDAIIDEDLGVQSLYGVFYTHSRFQPIVRWLSPHHHFHLTQSPDVARAVNKSHSIFLVMPWRMSYSAVRLDTSRAEYELMNKANEAYSAMKHIDVVAEENAWRIKTALLGSRRHRKEDERQLREEVAMLRQRIDTYYAHRKVGDRLAREARRLRDTVGPVYMRNFKINAVEQANGIKARASTGLKGTGKMVVSAEQTTLQSYISVQFHWHEDNFFGHSYDWNGRIDVRCDDQGRPDPWQGEGKFYDRFLETKG